LVSWQQDASSANDAIEALFSKATADRGGSSVTSKSRSRIVPILQTRKTMRLSPVSNSESGWMRQ
jgi:hypothetical protein